MSKGMVVLISLLLAALSLAACGDGGVAQPTPTPSPEVTVASPTPTHEPTGTPAAIPSPSPTPTAAPTASPTPAPATIPSGVPFSFDDFRTAWETWGMTVTLGAPNVAFKGFATPAFDARLARGSDSLDLSILVYTDRQAIREDWLLTVGMSPVPKEGRVLPDYISAWWNENVAVVVRATVGDMASDALDAFLSLGGPAATERQLAYVGADYGLWLTNPDGSSKRLLIPEGCGGGFLWAPRGDLIACGYFTIRVFDLDGQIIWTTDVDTAMPIEWSPDGRRLAYVASDESLHIVDLPSLSDEEVLPHALPIAWPRTDRFLVGLNPIQGQLFQTWEAHWMNPETGSLSRVSRLDNASVWFLPGAERAIVLGQGGLVLLDVETSEERLVTPLELRFPTEGVPFYAITISDDGTHWYAADASETPTVIYRIDVETGETEELGTVPGVLLRISPDGLVAYLPYGHHLEPLFVADLERGVTTEIDLAHVWMAWRPTP
jgi:hypothetical protein